MIGTIYLTVVSVSCGIMGLVVLWKRLVLFFTGRRATGHFARWEMRGLRRKYYQAVIAYEADDGMKYEFVGGSGSTSPKQKAAYPVLYPSGNPQAAVVETFLAYWMPPLAFFILAAGAAAAALKP